MNGSVGKEKLLQNNTNETFIQRGIIMGLIVIFALVTILAAIGTVKTIKQKNLIGFVFAIGTTVVFGAFAVATVVGKLNGINTVPGAH